MISKSQARSLIRKAVKRVPEGEEIRHLNIMPMMDMMTILLVAMIFQAASAATMSVGDVALPDSESHEKVPEDATTITIVKSGIMIEGKQIVPITNGAVDSSEKKGGSLGIQIIRLSGVLGAIRREYESTQVKMGKFDPEAIPEVFIVADKATPYRLLFEVIASARAEEAGFKRFRLIVLEKGSPPPPPE